MRTYFFLKMLIRKVAKRSETIGHQCPAALTKGYLLVLRKKGKNLTFRVLGPLAEILPE